MNTNNFASVSADRTFRMWDAAERAFLETFYGHKSNINSIDSINREDFITSGFDKQSIYWKINEAS